MHALARMLDEFVPESPVVRIEKKPAELVGFLSEASLALPPRASAHVSPTERWNWRRAVPSSTLLSAGWVCAALTLGALVTPVRTVQPAPPQTNNSQFRVLASNTPAAFSSERTTQDNTLGQPAAPTPAPLQETSAAPAPERARLATTPPPTSIVPATRTFAPPPEPAIQRVRFEPVAAAPMLSDAPVAAVSALAIAPADPVAPPVAVAPSMAVASTVPVARPITEDTAVRALVESYRDAYEQLDAQAVRRIWPGLDDRRLARAFSDLASQSLDFDDCRIDVASAKGVARCRGRATYVGRVGNRAPQTQARTWTFQVHKAGDRWAIDSVRSE